MDKKTRMGTDPLRWIKDSRGEAPAGKQSKQGIRVKQKPGRPKTIARVVTKSSQEGLPVGWTRATFIMREGHVEKLKALAYWDRKQLKEVVDEVLSSYLQGKKVKPLPEERK